MYRVGKARRGLKDTQAGLVIQNWALEAKCFHIVHIGSCNGGFYVINILI